GRRELVLQPLPLGARHPPEVQGGGFPPAEARVRGGAGPEGGGRRGSAAEECESQTEDEQGTHGTAPGGPPGSVYGLPPAGGAVRMRGWDRHEPSSRCIPKTRAPDAGQPAFGSAARLT